VIALGVVAFVVALLLSIMLHEAGHLLTAKRYGMKATQYFLGFGPTLFSRQRGETEYGVKAIPAGGFVKIVGMTPLETVDPQDQPRAFYRQPAPRRAVVLAAGSATHLVLAFLLVAVAFAAFGEPRITSRVSSVSPCVTTAQVADCPGQPRSPAVRAGLRAGDRIVAFDGQPVGDWEELARRIQRHPPVPTPLTVERNGKRVELVAPLQRGPTRNLDTGEPITATKLGFGPSEEAFRLGPLAALGRGGEFLLRGTGLTFTSLAAIPGQVPDLLAGQDRDGTGAIGIVGASRLSGQVLEDDSQPTAVTIGNFLLLVASLNLFVGIFNLLPLLPLDGGHLAILGWEQGRHALRRRRGYAGPLQRVDLVKLLPVAYAVIALFVGLTVLLVWADIANPVRNPFQ
jgi:membrane-associated protease RseP (regulator of RpoE activity)